MKWAITVYARGELTTANASLLRIADVCRPLLTAIGKALAEMLTTGEAVASDVRVRRIMREGNNGFILKVLGMNSWLGSMGGGGDGIDEKPGFQEVLRTRIEARPFELDEVPVGRI